MKPQTRLYDLNGVFLTVDGFWQFLEAEHPDIFRDYKILGDKDAELKRKVRPKMLAVYEHATDNGLYPVELMPHVKERLETDRAQGYRRTVFTSAPRTTAEKQLDSFGVSIDHVLVLDDIQREFNLPGAMKEDPAVFEALAQYVRQHGLGNPVSYVDDSQKRIHAAVQANQALGEHNLGTLFLFDLKVPMSPAPGAEYTTINDLLHLQQ